jgi:glycosyltransferase involved in cell wall biosynthesis
MRICGFSRITYWHGIKGGMDLHGRLLSEGMATRGHDVSIISTRHPVGIDYEERNGVKLFYLKGTEFGSRRRGWSRRSVKRFSELHAHKPFEVLWSQSFDAFGLATARKEVLTVPVVPTLHGSIQQEATTFRANLLSSVLKPQKIIRALLGLFFSYFVAQRPLLALADRIITVSDLVTEDLARWYGPKITRKCITIPNGIDTAVFRPDEDQRAEIRGKYGIAERETLLLTMGRITREKGHHLAVEALRQLRGKNEPCKLMVVGEGDNRGALEEQVQKGGLSEHVIFAGQVDNAQTPYYYNSADIFIMPTLTVEGLPFVLLEAMACAKPVIASRIGGNTTLLGETRKGLLVDPGKAGQISVKVRSLVQNPAFAKKVSRAAREAVLKYFSLDQMVGRTLQVMEEATRGVLP